MGYIGRQTIVLEKMPSIVSSACTVGSKEGEGPLSGTFDYVCSDALFGQKTWEQAESAYLSHALNLALGKARIKPETVRCVFAGDLLNQCISSSLALRPTDIPFFGIYGACSTMAEGLALAAMTVSAGYADIAAAAASSHFCAAERQFRMPLEYGGQRAQTAQWTVTGAGAVVLSDKGTGPFVTHVTPGKIVDLGVTDVSNMGAAMAPAAYDTLSVHFSDTGRSPDYYDLVVTGDLGRVGSELLYELFMRDGVDISANHADCGLLIFDSEKQDVHSGGSGCGCSAAVLCGKLLADLNSGRYKNILFAATGALMSPTSSMQGESIPSICCAAAISADGR